MIMPKAKAQEINLSEMALEDKIRQMVIIPAKSYYGKDIGGIFFGKLNSREDYIQSINKIKENSKIKPFISADLEGYWNPFEEFYTSKNFGEITNGSEAYELGKEHGKIMKELGFNLDFSPVVENRNEVWSGRSFTGNITEIKDKIGNYIDGLHENDILATAKHYPGGSMIKNPHWRKYKTEIFKEDLELFDSAIESKVDAIMVGHPIVYGGIDSNGKPSTVSKEVIMPLREKFDGLIISDAITMMGLRLQYIGRFNNIYLDLIKAGNDMIIDIPLSILPFSSTERKIEKRIKRAADAARRGEISEEQIDESVKKILALKGYKVSV